MSMFIEHRVYILLTQLYFKNVFPSIELSSKTIKICFWIFEILLYCRVHLRPDSSCCVSQRSCDINTLQTCLKCWVTYCRIYREGGGKSAESLYLQGKTKKAYFCKRTVQRTLNFLQKNNFSRRKKRSCVSQDSPKTILAVQPRNDN